MSAEQLLKEGRLDEALAELQEQVRRKPADPNHRLFLFQLLAVLGRWDRALTQLKVVSEMDSSSLLMRAMYGPALQAEALRAEIFAGSRSPVIFGQPEEWMGWIVEACRIEAQGRNPAHPRGRRAVEAANRRPVLQRTGLAHPARPVLDEPAGTGREISEHSRWISASK